MTKRILGVFGVVLLLAAGAGCSSDDPAPVAGPDRISLGVIPIVDVAPAYLGKAKGFFSKRGIELTMVPEQGGAPIVQGVLSGKYAFGFSNATSLIAATAGGAPLKAVANGVASTGRAGRDFSAVVVRDGSPIRTAKDLAGRKIAVNTLKNLGDTTIRQSVRKDGGDPGHIDFEAMPFSAMPAALQAGKVDAAWVVEPQLSEALTQGSQVVASNYVDTAPDLTVALYFAGTALLGKDPDLVKRFSEAIDESLAYAAAHPDEVRDIIGTYTPITDVVRTAMILPNWPHDINRGSLQRLATLGTEDGIFTGTPQLDQLLP
ncbi:ABC transporter substrate-binding protein [Winogradskya consettensis]|uniref:ABC transporter substrate-binding protein n=1 Tax=Winogradskya consettensis TaxID=113560 RepID=UPI001BB3F60A|nr:ABC transporter substrate-binding protein [Actinoplanes consettensis]